MTHDLIVLIPGIGGSRLEREGKPVYDLSFTALPRLIWNWVGGDIAFQGGSGMPDDGVVATGLFNNQLIPGYFGVDDYDGLCLTLQRAVADPTRQFFTFPYDWRASSRWAAKALDAFIRPKLHDWRSGPGGANAKLWLVCHSMGGIVARYFLEALGGAAITRHLVTIGTPHRGAPKALGALVNGMGLGPLDFSRVIRSFASTYELLPQYALVRLAEGSDAPLTRVADFFGLGAMLPRLSDADTAPPTPVGLAPLPHIERARLLDALEFNAAIRRPVLQRLAEGAPAPYRISCLFNRRQATPQQALWQGGRLKVLDDPINAARPGEDWQFLQGDGTVPGPAAMPIEWTDSATAMSVGEVHVAMPSSRVVTDLIYNLANPLDVRAHASDGTSDGSIGLKVPPLVLAGDGFEVQVDVIKAAQLTVSASVTGAPLPAAQHRLRIGEQSRRCVVLCLNEPGMYRVTAKSVDPARAPVHDWVVVISPP